MHFSTIVWRNATRRPLRSTLAALAIAVAVGTVVALVGIAMGFERSFEALYKGSGIELVVVRAGAKQRLSSTIDERVGTEIRRLSGVREVFGALADVVSFEDLNLYGVIVQGWAPGSRAFEHLRLISGRTLRPGDGKAVLLGSILAKNLDRRVGDSVEIYEGEVFQVAGIYRAGNVFEDGAMVIPLGQLQRLMDRPHQVTGFSVVLDQPGQRESLERVRREIEALEPNLHVMTTEEHVRSLTEIQLSKAMAWLTSAIGLLVGGFGVTNTMVMSVHERTREIGVLRAIGWKRRRILRMILLESVVISLAGGLFGTLGASGLVVLLTRVPGVNGLIDGRIAPVAVYYGMALAALVGTGAGALPAFAASRIPPSEALRYE